MKFIADVNIPNSTISLLKKLGHDVLDGKKNYLLAKDIEIIKVAQSERRIILTRDKDFLELTKFPKYKVPLIAIRIKNQKFKNITDHIRDLLNFQDESILETSITIVKEEVADSYPL